MAKSLTTRKQEFVRDSIYDAAIDLFVRKGFLQTNVDDVAQAAGVSRRSFFRYFSTKDHVLAHNIMKYGDVLVSAIGASPAESSAFEVVHDAVIAGLRFATSDPRTPDHANHCTELVDTAGASVKNGRGRDPAVRGLCGKNKKRSERRCQAQNAGVAYAYAR